ncbi:MAG: DUF4153 domain-containing protein [Alphaproteobacteria bacterium]|nr:DUF4153 domain-containing protein [Alphaproteobacteria bacterium]
MVFCAALTVICYSKNKGLSRSRGFARRACTKKPRRRHGFHCGPIGKRGRIPAKIPFSGGQAMSFKSFIARFELQALWRAFRVALLRFPLAVSCCVSMFTLGVVDNHGFRPFSESMTDRVFLFLALLFTLSLSASFYAEARRALRGQVAGLMIAAVALAATVAFVPAHFTARQMFFGAAACLLFLFAPYVGDDADEDSVWYFNYLNAVTALLGGVSGAVLGVGGSLILASIDYLFELHVPGNLYGDVWAFSLIFFGPVVFLSYLTRDFRFEKSECEVHAGIAFLANYLMVPLMLVYMGVLYAYTLRILLKMELPRGNVAYMVTGFGGLGVLTHLAVHALRDKGTRLLQEYYAHFYKIMAVPLFLLAVGIFTRIRDYGVTPERYAILVALAWLSALALLYAFRRRAHIKYVPMALCALCLAASFGPWSAMDVSIRSQKARLGALLEQAGVLQADGSVAKTSKDVSFEQRKQISSIVDFFYGNSVEDAIAGWVTPFKDAMDKNGLSKAQAAQPCRERFASSCGYYMPRKLVEAWGMEYASRWETMKSADYFSFSMTYDGGGTRWEKIAPYEYTTGLNFYHIEKGDTDARVLPDEGENPRKVTFAVAPDGKLTLTMQDGKSLTFDLGAKADDLRAHHISSAGTRGDAVARLSQEGPAGMRAQLRISYLSGPVRDGHVALQSAYMTVLFTPPREEGEK